MTLSYRAALDFFKKQAQCGICERRPGYERGGGIHREEETNPGNKVNCREIEPPITYILTVLASSLGQEKS